MSRDPFFTQHALGWHPPSGSGRTREGCLPNNSRWKDHFMSMSLDEAAEVFKDAMRQTVRRYSLWYLVQGCLLAAAGILAIIYPVISSVAVIVLLGWLLILSGVLQAISLIGAGQVPHFWLQLISVILAVLIGFLFLRDPEQ